MTKPLNQEEKENLSDLEIALRDAIAFESMKGFLRTNPDWAKIDNMTQHIAERSYKIADAMLKERTKNL